MTIAVREGLVGSWPLDEGEGTKVHDESGNGLDGRVHGAQWVEDREVPGRRTALEFQPSDTWVEVPYDPKLDIVQDITISAWVWKRASNDSQRWDAVVTKGPQIYVEPVHIHYNLMVSQVNSDEIAFFAGTATPPAAWSGGKVPPRVWTHIAFVRAGDFGQFYLNGAPTDRYRAQVGYDPGHIGEGEGFLATNVEFKGPMNPISKDANLYIGWDGVDTYGMDGRIRDVHVYNRALSHDEMRAMSGIPPQE